MMTYTFDVFSSLDGFAAATEPWEGYWGKQGPELLEHRSRLYDQPTLMVFGATTYKMMSSMLADWADPDEWVAKMSAQPKIAISSTMNAEIDLNWQNSSLEPGDAVDVVRRLKNESTMPLRSHGSLSMNRALMDAGLVDFLQITFYPVITGITGRERIFEGFGDFDLELISATLLDGRTQELIYAPHPIPR
ncbi:dihydrofolate reductase family protein [Glutamicibacter arilaitensis]|uniref:dihydrofolate reductase family protein n=1 Tax=Glutamicibacter arilaitensis TaxID=256701 RepID=UPI00384E1FEC